MLLVVAAAPALFLENIAAKALADSGWLASDVTTWLFPAYVIISSFSAWFCYPQRRALAWILLGLVVLTDLFMILLMNLT